MTRGRKINRGHVLHLRDKGYKVAIIAARLGCSAQTIYDIIRNDQYDRRYEATNPTVLDPADPGIVGLEQPVRIPLRDPLLRRLHQFHPELAP